MNPVRIPLASLATLALLASSASAQDLWQFDFRCQGTGFTSMDPLDPFWDGTLGSGQFLCSLVVDLDQAGDNGLPVETYFNSVVSATTTFIDDSDQVYDIPTPPTAWVIRVGNDVPTGTFAPTCQDYVEFEILGAGVFERLDFRFAVGQAVCTTPPTELFSTAIPTCLPPATPGTGTLVVLDPPTGADTFLGLDGFFPIFPSLGFTATPLDQFSEGCFGDGGDQMGCTACPCMNESTIGSGGGCKHSASDGVFGGAGARLIALGQPSISKEELTFEMENGVPNSFAVLNSGPSVAPNPVGANPCVTANPGSGIQAMQFDGLRCVISGGMGPVVRHGTRPIDALGYVGVNGNFIGGAENPNNRWGWGGQLSSVNFNHSFPNSSAFVAGQTRHFQAIFRDLPEVICGREQNTTQRVTCTMTP